jgi:hypothetical protein
VRGLAHGGIFSQIFQDHHPALGFESQSAESYPLHSHSQTLSLVGASGADFLDCDGSRASVPSCGQLIPHPGCVDFILFYSFAD